MKIVFLSFLHGFGGAEKQIVMLANAMSEMGHKVTLVTISVNNKCYSLDDKVDFIYLKDRQTNLLRLITRYNDIKNVLIEKKPDLTVNFWFQSAYMTAFMNKTITGKVVYSERGDPGDKEYSGLLGIIRDLSFRHINGFVFQSEGAQNCFNYMIKLKSVIIPNPVFINKERIMPRERRKVIVTVGRLHPQKNQKLLIDAFYLISNLIPDYCLEIYGDGELKNELQEQINTLKLNNRVFLKGTSEDIQNLIFDSTLFVLSSSYEGLPNTLLEAMALGIPCISTDCKPGGARAIINDGEDGLIVPIDDKKKLADAIYKLINDSELQKSFSAKAKVKMEKYKPNEIYSKWDDFFKGIK